MQLSNKPKIFPQFLLHFWNLNEILNILKKKMGLIADVFPKCISEHPSIVSRLKGPKHCWNLHDIPFTFLFWSLREKLSGKTSLLVIVEILGHFAETLTADNKYSVHNRENVSQPIQMQFSKKTNIFWQILLHIWHLHKILNILKKKKKDEPHSLCIFETIDSERLGYLNV